MQGTNKIEISTGNYEVMELTFQNCDIRTPKNVNFRHKDLTSAFNAQVTEIFQQDYVSPQPVSPSLQLPITGNSYCSDECYLCE
ncbi:hypothetical protein [Autumnicola psychrophila]|uniref:Uncharacterized protein n=1 Tax=Autumnicola psychrophila TaxID=3075592 RepID=A0ABU3DU15_9FLAO|nr:hypothetical protein [Zunongwangia sp. F225]MDT0687206.1 hypothetical protein [Zunongwangia sp. F225]